MSYKKTLTALRKLEDERSAHDSARSKIEREDYDGKKAHMDKRAELSTKRDELENQLSEAFAEELAAEIKAYKSKTLGA